MKKGQVTIMIILGILIMLMVGVGIYFSVTQKLKTVEEGREEVGEAVFEGGQIKLIIEHCLRESTKEGLQLIMNKGGYFEIPPTLQINNKSYWFVNQVNVQPTFTTIRSRLEKFIEIDIQSCLNYSNLEKQGFNVVSGNPRSQVLFGKSSTTSTLTYPVQIGRGEYEKRFNEFSIELNVPFRKMFEIGSKIINLQMKNNFSKRRPLLMLDAPDFDVRFEKNEDHIFYKLRDKNPQEEEIFELNFVSKFGRTHFKKVYAVQKKSNINPTVLPQVIKSPDNYANLLIMPGATLNIDGNAVDRITVQQSYPTSATRENVPFMEHLDDSATYGNITWNLTYPVYQFEPSGMRFNKPQRLFLHWNEEENPPKGKVGILYRDENGWRPIPSKANYDENFVYTDLAGFSDKTICDCGVEKTKPASTEAEIDPGGGCVKNLIVTIIILTAVIAILATGFVAGFGVFGAIAEGSIGVGSIFGAEAGLVGIGTIIAVVAGGVVGGFLINANVAYDVGKDSITFTPCCEQEIEIIKEESGGEGSCGPMEGKSPLMSGIPVEMTSRMNKCNFIRSMFCVSCSVKCSTKYK